MNKVYNKNKNFLKLLRNKCSIWHINCSKFSEEDNHVVKIKI